MKINTIQPVLNLQSFYDFVKLSKADQQSVLLQEGVFLDLDSEKDVLTRLYFLKGFFVELIFNKKLNTVVEMIPYKQGYKIERFIEVKPNPFVLKSRNPKSFLN
jgi:hypothetical protein